MSEVSNNNSAHNVVERVCEFCNDQIFNWRVKNNLRNIARILAMAEGLP